MVNDKTLRASLVKSLDMLYQGLQSSQRTTEAILGRIVIGPLGEWQIICRCEQVDRIVRDWDIWTFN